MVFSKYLLGLVGSLTAGVNGIVLGIKHMSAGGGAINCLLFFRK